MRRIASCLISFFLSLVCFSSLAVAGSYSDLILLDDPVAYWKLGEADTSDTAVNAATGANSAGAAADGAYTSGVATGQPSLVVGETDGAIRIDGGTADRMATAAFEKKGPSGTGYTVEYWAQLQSSPTGFQNMVGDRAGGSFYLMNYLLASNSLRPHVFTTTSHHSVDSVTALSLNETYHVASTWDEGTGEMQLFVNGHELATTVVNGSNPTAGTAVNTANPVFIGIDDYEPFSGTTFFDEVAIYNRALSPAQINDHAWVGHGGPSSVVLSTDVLGPGVYGDGYENNAGDSTVELIRDIPNTDAASVEVNYNQPGDKIDFARWVVDGNTAGNWGSDQHGRGGNLWLPGDGESDTAHVGFGAHANKLITFDLADIRSAHLGGTDRPLVFAGRFGVDGRVGSNDPDVVGGVWVDGELWSISPAQRKADPSYKFNVVVPDDAQYLTFAMLNGSSTVWDDATLRDPILHVCDRAATTTVEFRDASDWDFASISGPSASDYADANSGNNVKFYFDGGSYHSAGEPPGAGGEVTVLNDGNFPTGSIANSDTFLQGDGEGQFARILIDLGMQDGVSFDLKAVNVFGSNTTDKWRDYKVFDLYGSDAESAPSRDGDLIESGWELIGSVRESNDVLQQHTRHGVNMTDIDREFRYLLLMMYPNPAVPDGNSGLVKSSHYVEVDIFGAVVPEPAAGLLMLLGALGLGLVRNRRTR